MIVSINQPAYMPWLGYFDRIQKSDLHIVLDHVQFEKNSVTNRNKVRTREGWSWLTVPVRTKGNFGQLPIDQVEIDTNLFWAKKHWRTIENNYSKSLFFSQYSQSLQDFYNRDWGTLGALLDENRRYLLTGLGIKKNLIRSSELSPQSKKSDLVLELCKKVGATCYLSGPFGRDYLNVHDFEDSGIELRFHDYVHPEYEQVFKGFEPNMSVIDLLMNHGHKSLEILTS